MTEGAAADLALILETAREAGLLACKLREAGLRIDFKPGDSPVTNADLAADALLKARLRQARPDYGWLSEETADDPARLSTRRQFLVDPIDGTRAFARGDPWWTVCVAVLEDGRPVAGVVFAPQLDELYSAISGHGATLNGRPIRAGAASAIEGCRMVGDPRVFRHKSWTDPWPAMRIEQRNSTAYRICLVAADAADATLTFGAKHDWDLAAADIVATEAGAYVGDQTGAAFAYNRATPIQRSLVCTAPALAPLILERVRHIAI